MVVAPPTPTFRAPLLTHALFGDDGLNTSLADCQLRGSIDGRSIKLGEMKQPFFLNSLTATEKQGQCGGGGWVSDNR